MALTKQEIIEICSKSAAMIASGKVGSAPINPKHVKRLRQLKASERRRLRRLEKIQKAVLAALGCTKIDYRSGARMDDAARQIAYFVAHELYPIKGAKKC